MKHYTEAERAALIACAKHIISSGWASEEVKDVARIALAALAMPPIELPQRYSCEGYHIDEAYLVADDDGDCFDRDEVIEKLRQQGYEVQE